MDQKHLVRQGIVLILAASLLTACGQSSSNLSASPGHAQSSSAVSNEVQFDRAYGEPDLDFAESPAADPGMSTEESGISPLPQDGRKRIQYADLTLETREFATALAQLEQLVTQSGGYMESQQVDGQSIYAQEEYYRRTATLKARIPAEKLDEVMGQAGKLCNVTSTRTSVDDITDRYTDTETRLKTLQIQEERLLELLAKANTVEDMLTIESRLADVRYNIEALTGQKQKMDQQVTYSYLTLTLEEVVEYQKTQQQPATFGEKLTASLRRSGHNLTSAFQGILFFLIEQGPLLVVYGALFLLIFRLAYKATAAWQRRHPVVRRPMPPAGPGGWGPMPTQRETPQEDPPTPPEK